MPYDDLHCSFDKVTRCEELGIHVLVDDSPVNIARARDAGIVRRHDRPPLERRARGARRSDRRPRLDRSAGQARPGARPDRLSRWRCPTASAARRRSACGGAAACASWRSGPGWCRRARPTRRRSRGLLHRMAAGRRRAVVIGVHEGAASLVLVAGLPQGADLHLVDPFGESTQWWEPADEHAVKARGGPRRASAAAGRASTGTWAASPDVARGWSTPVDLVFIDGDPRARRPAGSTGTLWSPHVRGGGVVAFHGARGGEPGPTAVVTELFGAGDPPGLADRSPSATRSSPSSGSLAEPASPRSRSAPAPGSRGSAAAGGDPRARPAGAGRRRPPRSPRARWRSG